MSLTQWQELSNFFKSYLADEPLVKWAIIFAGIGGFFEAAYDLWLMIVWFSGRL